MEKDKNKTKMVVRWIRRPVSSGEFIYYDRRSGKIVYLLEHSDTISENDIKNSTSFHLLAPLKVYLDLSYRCNFECIHCVTSSSPDCDTSKELSTNRIINLIEELASIGVLEIAVGGGEPLIHKDCLKIFETIVKNDMNLIITTNGSIVTSKLANSLFVINPFDVRVSFEGGPKFHEIVRGKNLIKKRLSDLQD